MRSAVWFLAASLALAGGIQAQGRPDFSGTWRLDLARSDTISQSDGSRPVTVTITHTPAEMRVESTGARGTTTTTYRFASSEPLSPDNALARWRDDAIVTDAVLNVRAGEHRAALSVGAEFSSRYFRPGHYLGTASVDEEDCLPADAEFLRWTLSDGAAAILIEDRPAARGLSLKVDWVSLRSFADRFEPCMVGGGARDGENIRPWSLFESSADASKAARGLRPC